MTVGQKIRFFRDLRGYTQAELGEMVGLPGDRIRQYETNVRTPKPDKLREIAEALDVDVTAISYVDIGTEEDIMQIVFELEDRYRVHMQKFDGKAVLVFDDVDRDNSVINTYLNFWYDKRQAFALGNGNEERAREYVSWRGRFGSNEKSFEEGIIKKIDAAYNKGVEKLSKAKAKHCVTTSDLTRIICKLTPDLLIDTTTKTDPYTKIVSQGFIFDAGKLQDPESYSEDFAQFLYELGYFQKLGCNWKSKIEYTGSEIKIVYYIPVSSFSVVTSMVNDWLNYTANKAFYSVLAKEEFESRFEADLRERTANIKEEIELYGKK
jgi:transcriptional regulator with XRE-family HTH domain